LEEVIERVAAGVEVVVREDVLLGVCRNVPSIVRVPAAETEAPRLAAVVRVPVAVRVDVLEAVALRVGMMLA